MLRKGLGPVWVGILALSGMFLLGQDTWGPPPPECVVDADCDDGNVCTDDLCDPALGCIHRCAANGPTDPCCEDPACIGLPECQAVGEMAWIPAGCFDMGDHLNEGWVWELPVHNVSISGFQMDVFAVTNARYAECVAMGGCTAPVPPTSNTRVHYYGNPAYAGFPVLWVDWHMANAYCTWAGKRLPSEAEWEYAARGGLEEKRYPWGDTITGSDANFQNSGGPWENDTSPVGYYPPNGYGLFDMAGNVWEWVNDWYQWDYYTQSPVNDPPGPPSGTIRVLRGGPWDRDAYFLRTSYRAHTNPYFRNNYIGFRCAR